MLDNDIYKQKSCTSKKSEKKISFKGIWDNENYIDNSIKNSNTTVKYPMNNNNNQVNKKENIFNNKIIHGHNESAGSQQYKNNKKETNVIKNIKIKVVQKK